jgi:ribosome-associated protein
LAVDVASDRQAEDIVLLDVHAISGFADYMVLMSAGSVRQANALASELEEAIEQAGLDMHHREGTGESGWVLLDFGDLVLHVFGQEQREFYKLEQVWQAARQVVRVQ